MVFNKKSIQLIGCFGVILYFVPILCSAESITTKCPIRLQAHRTLGVTISDNTCPAESDLSLGALVELQAGTRAWLEPIEATKDEERFQIVCLNKSASVQKLKIVSAHFPWLAPLNMRGCSAWSVNRLVCKPPDNSQEVLLCAVAPKVISGINRAVQPKTSVPVRGGFNRSLHTRSLNGKPNFANYVAPGVNVCRQLLNTNQAITLRWTITTTGTVTQASIVESGVDKPFAACVLDVLLHTSFPAVAHETYVKLPF